MLVGGSDGLGLLVGPWVGLVGKFIESGDSDESEESEESW